MSEIPKGAHGHKSKRFRVVKPLDEDSKMYEGREGISRYDSIKESRERSGFDFVLEFERIIEWEGGMTCWNESDGFFRSELERVVGEY